MEYQIPDVHPAAFAPVSSLGKEQITTFDGKTVTADVWSWKFGPENKTVWTTPAPGNSSQAVLVKWNVAVEGKNFPNEYVNYTAVPASEAAEKPLQDSQTLAHAKATLKLVAADHAKSPRQPWFVAVGFHKPHLPFVFPDTFLEKYPAESIQLPPNPYAPVGMPEVAWQSYGETRNYADIKRLNATGAINTTLPDTTVKELRRAYYAAVSYTDDNVGQLLQALEEEGLADDTVVVFWGDVGETTRLRCLGPALKCSFAHPCQPPPHTCSHRLAARLAPRRARRVG